eukprot:gene9079-12245_t
MKSLMRVSIVLLDHSSLLECLANTHVDIHRYALEGATAGGCRALSRGLTFPFDTVKTFEQSTPIVIGVNSTETNRKITNYYSGVIPTVVSAIPANALFFIFYNSLEQYSKTLSAFLEYSGYSSSSETMNQLFIRIIISAIATLPQNLIKIPSELIKQRAQVQPDIGVIQLIRDAVSKQGLSGLYVGGNAQLLREIPYNAFQMAIYQLLKDNGHILNESFGDSATAAFFGLVAASIASILTQPADVIKTKLMTSTSGAEGLINNTSTTASEQNWMTRLFLRNVVFRLVYDVIQSKEGWKGLFVGMKPRLMIVGVGGMVYFYAADLVDQYIT